MNNDDITTKPTIETVLERVSSLGEQLNAQLTELRNGQDELRTDVTELRGEVAQLRAGQDELRRDVTELRAGQVELRNDIADLIAGQTKFVRRIETLSESIMTLKEEQRADMRGFDRRLERLESKSK